MDESENKPRESILVRREIIAPQGYVNVFHETKTQYIPAIDLDGLRLEPDSRNIGGNEWVAKCKKLLSKWCLIAKTIC